LEGNGFFLLIFVLVAALQLRNSVLFVSMGTMEAAAAHLDYVLYVLEHWRVPTPDQGRQMYQPPLFYFIAAAVAAGVKLVSSSAAIETSLQIFNSILGLINVLAAWLLLNRVLPGDVRARNLGISVVAFLPLGFYMNPNITNQVLSGSLSGFTFFLSSAGLFGRNVDWKRVSALGLACGLCLLTSYAGLFLAVSIATLLALRAASQPSAATRKPLIRVVVQFVLVAALVSGWLYVRNLRDYGDPFVGNWDQASGYGYEQEPGYRTARFYTSFDFTLSQRPERAKWSSFWDGIHGSLWADSHRFFADQGRAGRDVVENLILWLALLPSVGILLGFLRACRFLLRNTWDHPFFILVTTSYWTLASAILFTMELPFYSSVSAVFLLPLIPAIGVFAGLGLEWICRQVGRVRYVLYAQLALLYGLIVYVYTLPAS